MEIIRSIMFAVLLIAFLVGMYHTFFKMDGVKGAEIIFGTFVVLGVVYLIIIGISRLAS